jgi:hypothetical protein
MVLGEECVLACSDFISECDVVEEESMMGGRQLGGEFPFNVISVLGKFILSMRESEGNRLGATSPGRGPLCSCPDLLSGFNDSESDFRVSQATLSLFINDNMVE